MSTIPWSANKNARQVYGEYVDVWGFTYEGDTSDGHHVFRYPPTGAEVTLAHSPSAGWAWVKARRADAAKITGRPFRNKRDTHAAKQRAARARAATAAQRNRYLTRRSDAVAEYENERRIAANLATIRSIRSRLGDLTTCAARAYAETAIRDLRTENINLGWTPARDAGSCA